MYELQSVVAWAKTKDPEKTYDAQDSQQCLLATYLKEHGIEFDYVKLNGLVIGYEGYIGSFMFEADASMEMMCKYSYTTPVQMKPHTYGAFVTRAKMVIPS